MADKKYHTTYDLCRKCQDKKPVSFQYADHCDLNF